MTQPQLVTLADVEAARRRIAGRLWVTSLDLSMTLSREGSPVYLKLECQQKLRSFKARGALSKLSALTPEEKERGVLTVSSGNHGAGVALAARLEGVKRALVYVPESTPKAKTDKIAWWGGQAVRAGKDYDACHRLAMEALQREGLTFVDPCSDREVIAGQGTIGLEILEQQPEIDTIVVPIGGGGLITGVAVAAKAKKPGLRVIGVQTAACPAMAASLRDGVCYEEYPIGESVCDALVGGVGRIGYEMASQCIDQVLVLEEEEIKAAAASLIGEEKVLAECAGAVGAAAVRHSPELFQGHQTAVVISGGNIDPGLVRSLLADYL